MKAVKRSSTARRNGMSGSSSDGPTTSALPSSWSSPTTVELRGVPVHFPFKPYACQEIYMSKVLDALHLAENALLESPTGTGKTLCLLCATLAWQRQQARLLPQNSQTIDPASLAALSASTENKPRRVPTILYASRTHSQISQVVRELRSTRYRPRHAVLGSREQMCVNPKVKTAHATASDINHDCNRNCKDRKCRFRNQLEGFVAPNNESFQHSQVQSVMDMEDLVSMGKSEKVCPFYYTRSLVQEAELILIPYNYLFDKDARETTMAEVPWDNAVIIIDEGHNLESFASDSASFDLQPADIAGCIAEVNRAINCVQGRPELADCVSLENLARLKALFLEFEEHIVQRLPTDRYVYHGEKMMEIFRDGISITHANHAIFLNEMRKVNDLTMEISSGSKGNPKLDFFVGCVKRVFGESTESRCLAKAQSYRVHISPKEKGGGRTISYWCFAPSLAMHELADLNVRSIIVTSGTLSPLPSYSMELGLPFPHTLENPHIIGDDQVHVRVVGHGVSGKLLNSSYNRREDGTYVSELGNTLVSFAKIVPGGMLVFFPSYGVMETCIERWGGPSRKFRPNDTGREKFFQARQRKSAPSTQFAFPFAPDFYKSGSDPSTPWKRLLSRKAVIVEPKTTSELPAAIAEFHKFLGTPKSTGCVLMGVCRGKISEGIDFSHNMCRAVVITGLPFAPYLDPKVNLKREYLDGIRTDQSIKASGDGGFGGEATGRTYQVPITLSGAEWYTQQAHRAVNQAIGRVIRNKTDYGAVLLLDSRFGETRNQEGLSKWVRPHVQKDEGFGVAIGSLAKFYVEAQRKSDELQKKDQASPIKNGILLQYENEAGLKPSSTDVEDSMKKIAVVRESQDSNSETITQSYVPPDRVIARMDLNAEEGGWSNAAKHAPNPSNQPIMWSQRPMNTLDAVYSRGGSSLGRMKSTTGANDSSESAWSNLHPTRSDSNRVAYKVEARKALRETTRNIRPQVSTSLKADTKSPAVMFFELARACASGDEMTAIKKSIVEMKKYGDKNDLRAYMRAARVVLDVLIRHENFDNATDKSGMLDLFFLLLPQAHRIDVQRLCLQTKFRQSQFNLCCKQNMTENDYKQVIDLVSPLLVSIHCGTTPKVAECSMSSAYLRDCEPILESLQKYRSAEWSGREKASLTELFLRLVPVQLRISTQAMIDALESSANVQQMKNNERAKMGENGIDAIRFSKPNATVKPRSADRAQNPEITPQMLESQKSMEAALMQAEELNRSKRERIEQLQRQNTKVALKNPYATSRLKSAWVKSETALSGSACAKDPSDRQQAKKARVMTDSQPAHSAAVANKSDSQRLPADPIAQCLREVASDSYVNQAISVSQTTRKIQYYAPAGLKCSLCDMASKKVRIIEFVGLYLYYVSANLLFLMCFSWAAFDGRLWPYRLFHLLVEMDGEVLDMSDLSC